MANENQNPQVITESITCNQLMLLLSIYRGTTQQEPKMGTFMTDLGQLQKLGLISIGNGFSYNILKKGNDYINNILTIKSVVKECISHELVHEVIEA